MAEILRRFDRGSLFVMLVTLVLFVAALFLTGFTHDLLLEAGVFLVSVKLIIMAYKNSVAADGLHNQLSDIRSALHRLEAAWAPSDSLQAPAGAQASAAEGSRARPPAASERGG